MIYRRKSFILGVVSGIFVTVGVFGWTSETYPLSIVLILLALVIGWCVTDD